MKNSLPFKPLLGTVILLTLFAAATAVAVPPVKWVFKGFNYATWWVGNYYSAQSETQLDALKTTYANWTALVTTWYLDNLTDSTIESNTSRSHSYNELKDCIDDMHFRGFKVMLKPHMDCLDGSFRADITPSAPATWFLSYRRYMTNMARIAQQKSVEMLCIGTELDSMAVAAYSNDWKALIQAITNIYTGPITYTANHPEAGARLVPFWRYMDYASVDAYYMLDSTAPVIPASQLIADWQNCNASGFVGRNWLNEVTTWQAWHQRPVIFAEVGYASRQYAAREPWLNGGTYSGTAQSNCYEAMFEVWQSFPWFKGAFLWSWFPTVTGGVGDTDHTPQGKPGYYAVRKWFTNTGVSNTYVTISNAWSVPNIVTNNANRVVQFYVRAGTTGTSVTNVGVYLVNVGGPASKVKMTNLGGSLWRYAYTVAAGQTQDEKEVFVVGEDNNGSASSGRAILTVVNQAWYTVPNWVLYDGGDTGVDTDVNVDWSWGQPAFFDVTNSPRFGTKRALLLFTNVPSGVAQLRDPSWGGFDCSAAERLELWIKASVKVPSEQGLRIKLYSLGSKYSAGTNISLTTNFRKFDVPVSWLTNQAAGADAGFSMSGILGVEFQNAPVSSAGVKIFVDNVMLAARVTVFNTTIAVIDNSKPTNVKFNCGTGSAIANIASVTLDFSPIGGSKVLMTNLGGGNWRYTRLVAAGLAPGTYLLPVISRDLSGNVGRGNMILTVMGPVPKIIEIIYDGESSGTDCAWEVWWGTNTGVDITSPPGDVLKGLKSMKLNFSGMGGGVQVPDPSWWQGVDASRADYLDFYYKSTAPIAVSLFSYDAINGVQYSKSLTLGATAGYRNIKTNITSLTGGLFLAKKVVGFYVDPPGGATAWFDNIYLTAMVEITLARAVPNLVTNTRKNVVQFSFKAKSGNTAITNAYINLKTLGGPTNAKMTNLSGMTLFRYTFTVASNQLPGTYYAPVLARDNKGFRGTESIMLQVVGRSPYPLTIIYDGDTVPASPEQWQPTPVPPYTCSFNDVDGTTVAPHTGLLSGMFQDTNATPSQMFHTVDPQWNGIDVTSAAKIEIWARGAAGGEKVRIMPVFADLSKLAVMGNPVDITVTQNWGQWLVDFSLLTNASPAAQHATRFVGVYFEYQAPYTKGQTVFFDDVKFINYLLIRDQAVVPDLLDADVNTALVFSCKAFTMNGRITNVTVDLSPIGGGVVKMTNISGAAWTNFRLSMTYLSNTNVKAGLKRFRITARDNLGYSRFVYADLSVISKKMVVLWDFEDGTGQQWKWYDTNPSDNSWYLIWSPPGTRTMTPGPLCPSFNAGTTNCEYDSSTAFLPPYHGTYCLGWTYDMSQKWWNGGNADGSTDWNHMYYGGPFHAFTYGVRGECTLQNDPDFSTPPGYMMFLLVEPSAGLDDEDPFITALHCEGPTWADWYQGPHNRLIPGKWTKLYMNFSRCTYNNGASSTYTNLAPARRTSTLELGLRLSGAYGSYGFTRIFVDYVVSLDQVAPAAPTGLTVADPGTGGRLQLNWNKNGEIDVERYRIYQSTNNNPANSILIGSVTTNYFEDRGAWNGKLFYYWVTARDLSENESAKSAMAAGSSTGAMPNVVYPFKGVTLLSVTPGEFLNNSVHSVLTNIRDTGANIVSIPVTWYMAASNSSTITSNAAATISDSDLRHIMQNITNLQMKVMLVPKVEVSGGIVPPYRINPAAPAAWFAAYSNMIVKYATIASQYNCPVYSVGWRLHAVTKASNDAKWAGITSAVRSKFKNSLTYSAMWGVPQKTPTYYERPTYRNLAVWDDVDFIGIDAYFSLSYTATPYLAELLSAWNTFFVTNNIPNRSGFNFNNLFYDWFGDMTKWQETKYPGKGIIFTEVGYASRNFCAEEPWKENVGANNNLAQQNAYEAVFRRIWDQGFVKGTFWNHFKATPVGTPNTLLTPQGKPAYAVVKEWYSIKPHHFAITHDGGGESGNWAKVVIATHQVDDSPVPFWSGPITLDIDKGTAGAISWTNMTPCGSFVDWGAGTAKAVFTFNGACNGVVTLGLKDNAMETVNIRIRNGYLEEGTGIEDNNLIFTGPLSHFLILHDGYAVRNQPKTVTLQAIDVFGNVKVDYAGVVSLTAGTAGIINWKFLGGTNSSFRTNASTVRLKFRPQDGGQMMLSLRDNTAETIDLEAFTTNRNFMDNDANDPLRVVDFDHFTVAHDGQGLVYFSETMVVRAEDSANNAVYGVNGNVTISLDTNAGSLRGTVAVALMGGSGTFTALSGNRWVYNMVPSDGGVVTLSIIDNKVDTLDIEATDGIRHDSDAPPRYLIFMTHVYHYVSRKNPTPVRPYTTPATAATNIIQAWTNTSAGDVVLIIDNDTYPSAIMDKYPYYRYRTIAGAATNMPTVLANGANSIGFAHDFNQPLQNMVFRNLKLVSLNSPVYTVGQHGVADTNYFVNCVISNTGAFPIFSLDLNGGPMIFAYGCTFLGHAGQPVQTGGRTPAVYKGNAVYNADYVLNNPDNFYFYGNIVSGLKGAVANQGLSTITGAGICLEANYNTFYKGAQCGIAGRTVNVARDNVVVSNVASGIVAAAGTHDYNCAYGNTPNYSTAAGANDVSVDPLLANAAAKDFRLKGSSPVYNMAEPSGSVRGCPGGLTMGVRPGQASVSAVTAYTLSFVPLHNIPKAGQVRLTFPAACDISIVTQVSTTSAWGGTFTYYIQGNVLFLQRNNDGNVASALAPQNIIVKNVKNPSFGGQYSVTWETKEGISTKIEGDTLDFPRPSNCFDIIASDLRLVRHSPAVNAAGLPLNTSVTCTFNTNLVTGSVGTNSLMLQDSGWKTVPASYTFANGNKTAIITSPAGLQANEFYTVTVTFSVLNVLGGSVTKETQWHFRTGVGPKTPHEYNSIAVNANLSDWLTNNIVGSNVPGVVYEFCANDAADSLWGHTRQFWATWNTNNLYLALRKPVLSGSEWWDYVAIDTTRDMTGPTNGPAGWHPLAFGNNRRPEFLLMFDHNNIGPVWDAWTNYRWTGAVWQAGAITATNHSQDSGSIIEVRIPWTAFGGTIPNRVSLAAFVYTNKQFGQPLYDTSPEAVRGATNWVTIAPDNDGDEVPDAIIVVRMNKFVIVHDGSGNVNIWEPIEIRAVDNYGSVYSNYSGQVTVDITTGTPANVKFTNLSGAGTLTWLGNGKAVYQWLASDKGIVSLRIRDTFAGGEAVNIRVRAATGGYVDDNTEGNLNFNPVALLSMTKSGSPANVIIGDVITYRLEITNQSAWYSYDVRVVDPVPFGTVYVPNSLRQGPKASTYVTATNLTDALSDDAGSFDGTTVVFCGPQAGSAPVTSGALAANSVWAVYFQVKVKGTNVTVQAKSVSLTNTDGTFDGYCVNDGTVASGGLIAVGDTRSPSVITNLRQTAGDRDHQISLEFSGPTYAAVNNGATIMVGDTDPGGATVFDFKGYLTFGLGNVPAGATVTSATLFIRANTVTGAPDLPLHVDSVVYQNVYDTTTALADRYDIVTTRSFIQADYAQIASVANGTWVRVPSTSQVQFCQTNLKAYTEGGVNRIFQVRILDNTDLNHAGAHNVTFDSFEAGANQPYLRVYYETPGKEARGLTGFNLSTVSNRNITSATLFVYRTNVLGTPADIAPVVVDHVDYGNTLDAADYGAALLQGNIGNFAVLAPGWAALPVKTAVSNAWSNHKAWTKNSSDRWFQVRLRPTAVNTNDLETDQQLLGSAESAKRPYLKVAYNQTYLAPAPLQVTNIAVLNTVVRTNWVGVMGGNFTTLSVTKNVTNTTLAGAASKPVPGASLWFRIICSNKTIKPGDDVAVYDRIMTNTIYVSNSATAPGGWTLEYSTNASPLQLYTSPNYTAVQPPPGKVKWIRWKQASMPGPSSQTFRYRVIIR